LADC